MVLRGTDTVRFVAIDPGTTESAFVVMSQETPVRHGKVPNAELLSSIRLGSVDAEVLIIEQVASYGMPVGSEVFETVFWSGRFAEAWYTAKAHFGVVNRMTRNDVKLVLCHRTAKVNDAVIRQRLIDLYGGKEAAIGKKKTPGPLYGIKADVWAALALGRAWLERAKST